MHRHVTRRQRWQRWWRTKSIVQALIDHRGKLSRKCCPVEADRRRLRHTRICEARYVRVLLRLSTADIRQPPASLFHRHKTASSVTSRAMTLSASSARARTDGWTVLISIAHTRSIRPPTFARWVNLSRKLPMYRRRSFAACARRCIRY